MYRLLFLNGQLKGKRIAVQQGNLLIGRGSDCHVSLDDDDRVSHHHAMIEHRGGRPVIRDLGAMNRVEVNGRPVVEHRLRHGDRIEIGGTAIEFYDADKTIPTGHPRRFSKTQALAFLSVGLVAMLQLVFLVFFPLWQKNETVPVVVESTVAAPARAPAKPNPVVASPVADPATPPRKPESPVAGPVPTRQPAVAAVSEIVGPAPLTPSESAPPPEVIVDPLVQNAKNMLHDARKQIGMMNYEQADNMLHRAQLLAPDFSPLWVERASLFEKRRMFGDAVRQWEEVMTMTRGTPEYDKARAQRDRVARQEALSRTEDEPDSVAEAREMMREATEASQQVIHITSVDRERFRATADYDELRLLRITLRRGNDPAPILARDVRIKVEFFDRVEGSDRIVASGALVEDDGLQLVGAWPSGEARTVTASYMVTRGFRETERARVGERRSYEGYRVSVYYKNQLQDQAVMPRRIASL